MKVAVLGNQSRAMVNFWSVLIRSLVRAGHEVVCLAPAGDSDWEGRLRDLGARLVRYPLDRKGLNPLRDLRTLLALRRIFLREKPDALFAYTIKPVIYGTLAAALAGHPAARNRHVMITGLGYMFEADSPIKRILRHVAVLLYRLAFSLAGTAFFQNAADRELFERLKIVPKGMRLAMTPGTGVDLERFSLAALPPLPLVFLLIGRLLAAKGLYEYYEAAKLLRQRYPDARFQLLGPPETGLGGVPLEEARSWHTEGVIEYLGEASDVRPYLAAAHVLVLPSYREGAPTAVMEAMASGRAAVVTDVPGCCETVTHNENGRIVRARDAASLAAGMEWYLANPSLAAVHGANARKRAEAEFDADNVASRIMAAMGVTISCFSATGR